MNKDKQIVKLIKLIEEKRIERDNWEDTAKQFARNAEYYRGLVVSIGDMFGESARIADDGVLMDSVLCARVPELVRKGLCK